MTVNMEIREVLLELWYEFEQLELHGTAKEAEYAKRSRQALLTIAKTLGVEL